MRNENVVQKIWNLCHILRGDGISYHEYISELTYLLFLKVADETKADRALPEGYRWSDLVGFQGADLLGFYQEMLTHLGASAASQTIRAIYAFPTTVFSHSENLKAVIEGVAEIDWHSVSKDGFGDIYEGLLSKNSQDARSGAGQYFTPRPLVNCIVEVMRPSPGEIIQDPAAGSGGFLISADHYVRNHFDTRTYSEAPPRYEGTEIEKSTYRICLMNVFLHGLDANIINGDALTEDAGKLQPADLILANPPFGVKAGSARQMRSDLPFPGSNKQLAFLQHIYLALKPGGRAAVVLPDNALFESGVGRAIRKDLMDRCVLHTILRLPSGIFYSAGVKTQVLFFYRPKSSREKTSEVWVYDLRSDGPSYSKGSPLKDEDFADFRAVYGEDANGGARTTNSTNKRWRKFSRNDISDRDENLNLVWLIDTDKEPELSSSEEIVADIVDSLRAALSEMEVLGEELNIIRSPVSEENGIV